MDVICLGSIVADILIYPAGEDIFSSAFSHAEDIIYSAGGDACNVAVALKRMDTDVRLTGQVGGDIFGENILKQLKTAGLNTDYILTAENEQTTVCVILIDDSGSRRFVACPRGNNNFGAGDIEIPGDDKAKVFYLGSLNGLPGLDGGGYENILAAAKAKGMVTVSDLMCHRGGGFDSLKDALKSIDIFLPSITEARRLTGLTEPAEIAGLFYDCGVKTVVIKLGDMGCLLKTGDIETHIPAFKVKAVDTSGAGDCFAAGYIKGYLMGYNAEYCAKLANAAGALGVTALGTTAAIKSFNEVFEIYNT